MSNARFTRFGWLLFSLSALLFAWSAVRARDWVAFAGAIAFLLANVSFMIALSKSG